MSLRQPRTSNLRRSEFFLSFPQLNPFSSQSLHHSPRCNIYLIKKKLFDKLFVIEMTINMPLLFCSIDYKLHNVQEKECKASAFIPSRNIEKKSVWDCCMCQRVVHCLGPLVGHCSLSSTMWYNTSSTNQWLCDLV